MILIEITGSVDPSGATRTFYLSSEEFVTAPSDSPPSIAFVPRLEDAVSLGLHMFSDGTSGGGTELEVGQIELVNLDGMFDAWKDYSFDGRPIVIRSGQGGAYPGAFPVVLTCTAEGAQPDWNTMSIRLRDKQFMFERPAGLSRYLGTNVAPEGLEGTEGDLKDAFKPRLMGRVFNREPYLVNASKLTYQVNDGAVAEILVYDRGVAKTLAVDYATSALLQEATLTTGAGLYSTCLAEGYFRLHDDPQGQITFDAVEGATLPDRTSGQLLYRLALSGGLTPAEINHDDIAALDVANSAIVGIYIEGEETYREAMDRIAASVGAYYVFDPLGVLRMGVFTAPLGASLLTLYDFDLGDEVSVQPADDDNVPTASVTILHSQVVTQTDLAGSVSDERRAFVGQEYRKATSDPSTVKAQWLLADEIEVATCLTDAAAAKAEANRRQALHGVPRLRFEVVAPVDLITRAGVWMGREVALDINRFGLAGGRSLVVTGMRFDLGENQVTLSLWG